MVKEANLSLRAYERKLLNLTGFLGSRFVRLLLSPMESRFDLSGASLGRIQKLSMRVFTCLEAKIRGLCDLFNLDGQGGTSWLSLMQNKTICL